MIALHENNKHNQCIRIQLLICIQHVEKAFNNPKKGTCLCGGVGFLIYYDKLKAAFRLWYSKAQRSVRKTHPRCLALAVSPSHPQPSLILSKMMHGWSARCCPCDGLEHFGENFSSRPPLKRSLSKTLFNIVMENRERERGTQNETPLDYLM